MLEGASFGMVDGAICALGAAIGIATATNNTFLAALSVFIFAISDSFGNAIGFYLSQVSERNVQIVNKRLGKVQHVHTGREIFLNGVFTFISTILVYLVVIIPFIVFPLQVSVLVSSLLALVVVFGLGAYNAKIVGGDTVGQGLFYSLLTFMTAVLCYIVGIFLNRLLL